jgi:N-acetylmuramoyl-L-alanine amidase
MKKIISFITIVVLIINMFTCVVFAEGKGFQLFYYDIVTGDEVVFDDDSLTFDESVGIWFEISKRTFNYLPDEVLINNMEFNRDVLYIDFNNNFFDIDSDSLEFSYFLQSLKKTIFTNSSYTKIILSVDGEDLAIFGERDFSEGLIDGDMILAQNNYESDLRVPVVPDPVIVLDPGHGGIYPSAIYNGVEEKMINLDIGLYLRDYLENKGATVIMTRTTDTQLNTTLINDLQARAAVANNNNADFFVSIHANGHGDPLVSGVEAFYPQAHDVSSSIDLAEKIADSISSRHSLSISRLVSETFIVLTHTQMPAVLAEVGYMSNSYDFSLMDTTAERQALAYSTYLGIRKYWYGY